MIRVLCLVSLLVFAAVRADDCDKMNNCIDCVNTRTWMRFTKCRWCPLTRQCHTYAAFATDACIPNLDVKYSYNCPAEETYGTYDKDLSYEQMFISAIAYTNEPEKCLADIKNNRTDVDLDYQIVSQVAIKCNGTLFENEECAAVVALSHSQRSVVVSFRGSTESSQLVEELLKTMFEPTTNLGSGHVQTYFYDAFNKLSPCLTDQLEGLHEYYPYYTIRFSGHSLGGALASIAAFSYVNDGTLPKDKVSLYTYGMPRVGDKLFAAHHDSALNNSFRVVNYRDCVPHLPACIGECTSQGERGPYHHRTEVFYDTNKMQKTSAYTVCHSNEDENCSNKYQGIIKTSSDAEYCYDNHASYFGVSVGTLCSQLGGSAASAAYSSDQLSDEQCSLF